MVWIMVPAGDPTEQTVDALADLLDDGRHDRRRRQHQLARRRAPRRRAATSAGIHYVDVGTSGGVWGLEVGYCMMVGGHEESVAAAGADPRRARPAGRLAPLRRRRRRPLREDGPQRRGVRDHAGLRRGLRADAQVEVPDRPQGGRRALEPRLGRPLVAVRARRARVRAGGQRPRGHQGPRQRLRRGPLDDHRRHRPRRADAGDHRVAVRALLLARRRRLHAPRARRAAQPVRRPRRRADGEADRMAVAAHREPARRRPRAAPGPADHAGDLRRHRRPRPPQAAAGALQPRARGRAARALQPDRRLAPRSDRRRLPRPGARVDPAVLPPPARRRRCSTAARARCTTSASRSTTRRGLREARRGDGRARRRRAAQPLNRVYYLSTAPEFFPVITERDQGGRAPPPRDGRRPRGDREAVRHRPRVGARAPGRRARRRSASARSSASTTTWARRPSRT